MPDRVMVTVLLIVDGIGDQPDMAHVAIEGTNASMEVPAERIASDTEMPVNELPGRKFEATWITGKTGDELSEFRLANDPRI